MSELRRNGGPDDADKPAADLPKAEQPGRPRGFEIRTADQNPDWPVDRRKVTAAQKYYHELIKQAGDVPPVRETGIVYVQDWATGKSLDDKYPPVVRDKGRTKPDKAPSDKPAVDALPDELKRDNADLEARTIERTEEVDRSARFSDMEPKRRKSHGTWDKIAPKTDGVIGKAKDLSDGVTDLFDPPQPTGQFVGCAAGPPEHITDQYAGHHVGDVVATAAALSVIAVDLGRKLHEKINQRKDGNAGNG